MKAWISLLFFLFLCACNSTEGPTDLIFEDDQTSEGLPEFRSGDIISTVNYRFVGCFGSESRRLEVIQSNGKKTALLIESDGKTYMTKLDSVKLRAFNDFIEQLKNTKFDFGCTTTAYYNVIIGNETIEREDGGCSWAGFQTLRNALFNQ